MEVGSGKEIDRNCGCVGTPCNRKVAMHGNQCSAAPPIPSFIFRASQLLDIIAFNI